MRICLLSYRSYRYSGGQGVYLRYLSRALCGLGHEVDVISGPPYPDLDPPVRLIKLPSLDLYSMSSVSRLFINPLKLNSIPDVVEWLGVISGYFAEPLSFGMRAYEYIRRNSQYDIVHDNQTMAYGILKIQQLGLPVVETIHHSVFLDRELAVKSAKSIKDRVGLRWWYSFLNMQKKVARQLPYIITVSYNSAEHIAQTFDIPRERLRVVYNGIDTSIFYPARENKRLENKLLTVTSGNIAVKGLNHLLEAVAALRHQHPVELVVIGKGADNPTVQKLVSSLGIIDYVKFMGEVSTKELAEQYRSAAIVVVPSTYEGFGLPAAEAMACGAPVVATTAGALPEVVGDAGLLVPPGDIRALVNAISALLHDRAKRLSFGQAGQRRATQNFSWQTAAIRTLDVYSEALERQRYFTKQL